MGIGDATDRMHRLLRKKIWDGRILRGGPLARKYFMPEMILRCHAYAGRGSGRGGDPSGIAVLRGVFLSSTLSKVPGAGRSLREPSDCYEQPTGAPDHRVLVPQLLATYLDQIVSGAHGSPERPGLIGGCMQHSEAVAVGAQQIGEDVGVAGIALGLSRAVASPLLCRGNLSAPASGRSGRLLPERALGADSSRATPCRRSGFPRRGEEQVSGRLSLSQLAWLSPLGAGALQNGSSAALPYKVH